MSDASTSSAFDAWARAVQESTPGLTLEVLRNVWDNRPVRIDLERPVEFAGKDYDHLTLRPLTAGHLRDIPVGGSLTLGHIFTMAARQAGVSDQVVNQLVGRDVTAVSNVASAFFALLQGTGEP